MWPGRLVALGLVAGLAAGGFAMWKANHRAGTTDAAAAPTVTTDPFSAVIDTSTSTTLYSFTPTVPAPMLRDVPPIEGGSTPHQEGSVWLVTPADAERVVDKDGHVIYRSAAHDTAVVIQQLAAPLGAGGEQAARDLSANLAVSLGGTPGAPQAVPSIGNAYVVHISDHTQYTDVRYLFVGTTAVTVIGAGAGLSSARTPSDITWLSLTVDGTAAITG